MNVNGTSFDGTFVTLNLRNGTDWTVGSVFSDNTTDSSSNSGNVDVSSLVRTGTSWASGDDSGRQVSNGGGSNRSGWFR